MVRLALVDYGAGNLASVAKALAAAGADLVLARTPAQIGNSDGIVVPGVGNFKATRSLDTEWRQAIVRLVDTGVPLLGICLGMQWLFDGSDEAPGLGGLGLLAGRCGRLQVKRPLKVPHVGWNELTAMRASSLLEGIGDGVQVYFTHSFAAPVTVDCAATTVHGEPFAAAVQRGHVCGVQFHPEKSGDSGLQILRNFVGMARS